MQGCNYTPADQITYQRPSCIFNQPATKGTGHNPSGKRACMCFDCLVFFESIILNLNIVLKEAKSDCFKMCGPVSALTWSLRWHAKVHIQFLDVKIFGWKVLWSDSRLQDKVTFLQIQIQNQMLMTQDRCCMIWLKYKKYKTIILTFLQTFWFLSRPLYLPVTFVQVFCPYFPAASLQNQLFF